MTTTADGNVSVRAVAKTFASGKTEKLVHQTLAECDLPSGKVRWDIASPYSSVFRIHRVGVAHVHIPRRRSFILPASTSGLSSSSFVFRER